MKLDITMNGAISPDTTSVVINGLEFKRDSQLDTVLKKVFDYVPTKPTIANAADWRVESMLDTHAKQFAEGLVNDILASATTRSGPAEQRKQRMVTGINGLLELTMKCGHLLNSPDGTYVLGKLERLREYIRACVQREHIRDCLTE
jgi:hypothetical protein